jgi:hypothetical protein
VSEAFGLIEVCVRPLIQITHSYCACEWARRKKKFSLISVHRCQRARDGNFAAIGENFYYQPFGWQNKARGYLMVK